MKKTIRIISCLAAFSLVSAFPISSSVNAATYKNCALLNVKYPKGIAMSRAAAARQKITPRVSASIYRAHKKLDKDKDGTVCEVKKISQVSTVNSAPGTNLPPSSTTTTVPRVSFGSELVPIVGTVTGAYYGTNFPNRSLDSYQSCGSRVINTAKFDYELGAILPCSQTDFVLLKYQGTIPKSNRGTLTVEFQAGFDDGIFLSIDGKPLIDDWTAGAHRTKTARLVMDLSVDHVIELWYYEINILSSLELYWRSVTTTTLTAAPSTTPVTAPRPTTTVCVPDSFALTVLINDRGKWANWGSRVSVWIYGDPARYSAFATIAGKNDSVFDKARQALNECKRISYRFDDFETVYAAVRNGLTYRSVASLITS
jgi:hypothetical protein